MNSIAIVVSSCDAFFDNWRPFAFFFRKFWPDCPFPIYLITNELRIHSSFIRAISVGEDRGWGSNMKKALNTIEATRVLYLQEDYFLNAPVQREQMAADIAYACVDDPDAFCFRARSQLEPNFEPLNERYGVVPVESDGRTRCQLTLWKRDSLLSILRDGETAWEMEAQGSERTRGMKVISYSSRALTPMPYLMSAVVRGLWTREALRMCEEVGVEISPRVRGIYSPNEWLQRWRRAKTRKRLRTEISARIGKEIELD